MAHLIAVFLFSGLLGWLSGDPGIAYVAMCVELLVTLQHAKANHGSTPLGRVATYLQPQVLVILGITGLLLLNSLNDCLHYPRFWLFGSLIGAIVGAGSILWHISVHIETSPMGQFTSSTTPRILAIMLALICLLLALIADGIPLHTSV